VTVAHRVRGRNATDEEASLLGRVAMGDQGEAMRSICDRYAGRLYGLGMKLLGDRGMAEEMVQDTFVRLWRSAGRYDPERGSVPNFIFTIARRVAVDLQRRRSSRPLRTGSKEDAAVALAESSAAEDVASGERFDQILLSLDVRDALDRLSPKHRETLELYFDQDLSQRQIAARLGVPLGTVKTRAYHALRALRTEFEERGLIG
jgi:RNA polymerase sigma-70 factor (ECF subfamily)